MKRKFTFLLMVLLALTGFKSWGQETLTVYENGTANGEIPLNTGWIDAQGTISQCIIPASELGAMTGGSISQMQFYIYQAGQYGSIQNAVLECSLGEVATTTITSAITTGLTTVWSGNLNFSETNLTVTFTTPYQYNGGNLVISFYVVTSSSYTNYTFCGTTTDYQSCFSNHWISTNTFLPKTTFTYTGGSSCIAPTGLTASGITATGATISWTDNGAESYDLAYGVASAFDLSNPSTYTPQSGLTATSVQLTGLTAETEYKCAVKAHCSGEEESAWSSVVAFTPSAKTTLTVNDGTETNEKVPFWGYNADYHNTQSQFIIPANQIENLAGGTITDLTFYVSSPENKEFTYNAWKVYVKEVDETSVGYTYIDFGSMTEVYSGGLNIVDNKLVVHFNTPYVYNSSKNLMIGFCQTNHYTWAYTYWLGKSEGSEMRSRGGYEGSHASFTFLPKTTFTYLPAPTYNVTVIPSEHGVITADPKTDVTAGTTVSLSATPNTGYVFLGEWHVTNTTTSEEITVTDNQFTMPDSDVTVTATFEALVPHTVTIADNIQHGTVELAEDDPEGYYVGETIFLTVTPDEGYFYPNEDEITVTDDSGNPIDVTITEDHQYSFAMPNSDVTVTAEFNMYYMVNFDEEMLGGYIDATSDLVHFDQHPYFKAGTDVYFVPNSDEDYEYVEESILVYKGDSTEGESVEVDFNSGLAHITMPDTDIFVTAEFNRIKYNVTNQIVNPTGSGSFNINNNFHIEVGQPVYISNIEPAWGYQLASVVVTRNDNQATVETFAYYGDYLFYMPDSDVTVTVNFEEKPYYNVTVGTVTNGTVSVEDATSFWAGVTVWLNVQPLSGDYILESITATPEEGDPITPTHNYSNYYTFTMPSSNVTISATFRLLQSYTINYYVNGELDRTMQCREDGLVNNDGPQNVAVPAGMTYEGWGVAEIGTYATEKPAVLGNAEYPTQDYDLYAVLRYTESVPAGSKDDKWVKVTSTSDLKANDKIVLVYNSKIMCQRWDESFTNYEQTAVSVVGNEINSLPENAIEFTLVNESDNWKLKYTDWGNDATLSYTSAYQSLVPQGLYGASYDNWIAVQKGSAVIMKNANYDVYIAYSSGQDMIYPLSSNVTACEVFKLDNPFITNTYYMTSVLADGEVAANTTAKNIIITTGTVTVDNDIVLTMAENGLFRNENAAKFVFEDGAQLITNNTGVLATMKKNITETDTRDSEWTGWYTISSPLANSVEFAEVENLIPSSGVTGTDYDLYRFDEANSIWVNSRVWQNNEPNTTIIANPNFKTIDKGLGYIYANEAGAELEFKGEINVADVENVNLTMTADKGKGFNLIGNPFAQNIKMTDVKAGTAILAGGFYVLTNQDTWATEPITTGTIAPLQGFLVQATTAGTATISKPTAAPSKGERSEQNTNIEMIVSNSTYRDNAFAMFGEGIGLNKVNHRNTEAPMLYVPQDGEKFAIAFMDENTTVFPLNFKAMTTGKYSISLKATDDINTLVLVDNMTGVETNMLLENSYSFNGSPADSDGRFTVKLSISHSNGQSDNEHFVYQNGKELVVNGEGSLQIFDVLGRVVISEEVHGQTVYVGNLSEGAYIVRMTGNEVKTQKIIIR